MQLILVIGLILTRPAPMTLNVSFSQHYVQCQSTNPNGKIETAFMALTCVFAGIMVLFATFLAYKTRAAGRRYSHYSETKQMGLSV